MMEERWGFLTPWSAALNKRLQYNHLEFEEGVRDVQKRRLVVTLPMRKFCSDEEEFRLKFQQVREALMLLSAVAHVDQSGWKYLLSKHCGVSLGKEGGEKLEEEIPARFLVLMDLEERKRGENDDVDSDIVDFCCIRQKKIKSEDFLAALRKITTFGRSLHGNKLGEEVKIPVRVLYQARQPFSEIGDRPVEELAMAARAERVIKERLELLEIKDEESGSLRCVFVLEPMIAEFTNLALRVDMIETISALLSDNVRLSRLSLNLRIDRKLKTDKLLAKMSFGRLVRSVFDHTRRSPELSNTQYCTEGKSLQVGTMVMHCDTSLTSLEFEALCSAMVTNQTTKRLLLSLWLDPKDANTSTTRWKWLAYALFSKRARACSALESLTLTSIGSMSIADMEAFVSVMTSKHPEEELFGTCGQINGRNATFEHSITNFRLDEAGESLELDVPTSVRTISDDGQSEWVNGIIPGYGRCLFRRDDLIFQPSCEEYHSGIASLTIGFKGFNAQAVGGLGAFISAVGPPLRFLALDATRVNFDANFIVQCCPNLEELSLRSLVTDVRFDFTECQPLPTLRTDWTDSIAISTVLQDSCSPFTKYLCRLLVRLNNVRDEREVHDDVRINASVAGMLQMLEVNQTLEYLDVIAPLEYRGFLDKFKAHHLKPICRSTPFPVRSKIALLSIFSCHNDVHNQSKATYVPFDLDQHILHGIFQYAAPPILREVYFRGLDWIDKYNEVPI